MLVVCVCRCGIVGLQNKEGAKKVLLFSKTAGLTGTAAGCYDAPRMLARSPGCRSNFEKKGEKKSALSANKRNIDGRTAHPDPHTSPLPVRTGSQLLGVCLRGWAKVHVKKSEASPFSLFRPFGGTAKIQGDLPQFSL